MMGDTKITMLEHQKSAGKYTSISAATTVVAGYFLLKLDPGMPSEVVLAMSALIFAGVNHALVWLLKK